MNTLRGQDKYGRVGGEIPPLVLGTRVFDWSVTNPIHLKHIAYLGDSLQFQWVDHDGTEFTQRDYWAPRLSSDTYVAGNRYVHVMLTETRTRNKTCDLRFGIDNRTGFNMASGGLYSYFPWYVGVVSYRSGATREASWRASMGDQPCPPFDYFGRDGWTPTVRDALITYMREVHYWGTCIGNNWTIDPALARQTGDECAAVILNAFCGMKPKELRKKYGLRLPGN